MWHISIRWPGKIACFCLFNENFFFAFSDFLIYFFYVFNAFCLFNIEFNALKVWVWFYDEIYLHLRIILKLIDFYHLQLIRFLVKGLFNLISLKHFLKIWIWQNSNCFDIYDFSSSSFLSSLMIFKQQRFLNDCQHV